MKHNHQESSAIYHISPVHLRSLGVEKHKKSRLKAYGSHSEHRGKTPEERAVVYDQLKAKIAAEGFDPACPITIKLNRKNGKDQIWQGHHRLAMAIELGLDTVPVRFLYERNG